MTWTRTLLVVAALLLAGCAGGGGDPAATTAGPTTAADATDAPVGDATTADGPTGDPSGDGDAASTTTADGPAASLPSDPGWATGEGGVNTTALFAAHFRALNHTESFTAVSNWTVDGEARQDMLVWTDLADGRLHLQRRLHREVGTGIEETYVADGRMYDTGRLANGEAVESRVSETGWQRPGRRLVSAGGFDESALEYAFRLDYRRDGTTTRDGRRRYRLTATGVDANASPATVESLFGTDVAVSSGTLLVDREGAVRQFSVTFAGTQSDGRRTVHATFDLRGVNATDVTEPAWVGEVDASTSGSEDRQLLGSGG